MKTKITVIIDALFVLDGSAISVTYVHVHPCVCFNDPVPGLCELLPW